MRTVYYDKNKPSEETAPGVICLGYFDGLHRGHQALIETGLKEARKRGVLGCVYTFDALPQKRAEGEITPLPVKERLLREMGVEVLFVDSFAAVRELSPRAFVEEVLIGRLQAVCVVTGFNYTFGHKGTGDAKLLGEICAEFGIEAIAIPKIEIDGVGVASRRIRREILGGNMKTAQKFLGRPFFIQERVIEGRRLGRKLGVPTINQRLPKGSVAPLAGVYRTQTTVEGKIYPSVTNVGRNPTVAEGQEIRAETHILDFFEDLYDREIKVEFLQMLREEKKFDSIEELQNQLNRDIEEVRAHFSKIKK